MLPAPPGLGTEYSRWEQQTEALREEQAGGAEGKPARLEHGGGDRDQLAVRSEVSEGNRADWETLTVTVGAGFSQCVGKPLDGVKQKSNRI